MKVFNWLLVIIISTLSFMSIIALFSIHWAFFNQYSFSFTPKGIDTYLITFGKYKSLFTATVATIAVYFGLHRLKVATDANRDKLKQDRFSEWKTILDIRFIEVERLDPYMKREFVRIRRSLFLHLYERDFTINNRVQLELIFKVIFQDLPRFFERQNKKYIDMGGIYPDKTYSYSFDNFQFLLLGSLEKYYSEIQIDLQALYINAIDSSRIIDGDTFQDISLRE